MALDVASLPPTKVCSICKVEKPSSDFHFARTRGRVYLQGRCVPCGSAYFRKYRPANLEAIRSTARACQARRLRDPVKSRQILDSNLRSAYGITVEDFERMVFEQGGSCAICGNVPSIGMSKNGARAKHSRLCVDHDHATGKVRGLLCHGCNVGIGWFGDRVSALRSAADYLTRNAL